MRSEKCFSQSEAGRSSCLSDQHEIHKLGRGHRDLASCQVSLNSIQRFQRRSRKCLSQSEAGAVILVFFVFGRVEKHKLGGGRWDLASWHVALNSVLWFEWRSRKCISKSEAVAAILVFRSARKTKTGRGCWALDFCRVSANYVQWSLVSGKKTKCENIMTDGQFVITMVNFSLRLRCTKITQISYKMIRWHNSADCYRSEPVN